MVYGLYEDEFVVRHAGQSIDILTDLPDGTSLVVTPDDRVWHVAGNVVCLGGFFGELTIPGTKHVGAATMLHDPIVIT